MAAICLLTPAAEPWSLAETNFFCASNMTTMMR
ncbi:MAG: hypothetical protein JWP84_2868 [Tardiphaga sp.]|jgi:hypothetical protein|nr:hypothetical protein [Tardiphaga sp.]